jgi:hypothetical protein
MNGQYCLDGPHLHNDDVLDDQIDTIVVAKIDAFVDQPYGSLCHIAKLPGM